MNLSVSNKKRILICFIVILNILSIKAICQQRKYSVSNAHAHNDYNHPIPFWTVYRAGFGSIEADIFLRNNKLYVAHDTADIIAERTLQSLYLDPLQQVIQKNRGYVYADSLKSLLLLIDLKTAAEPTLQALLQVLQQYEMITGCPTLKIVITGSQPDVSRLTSFPSYIFFDGNLSKKYSAEALKKIAIFSNDFRNYSPWKGEGMLIESDLKKIDSAVRKAHLLNKPIRFWAAPDLPSAWHQLMVLNVDYINTDKINVIPAFLNDLSSSGGNHMQQTKPLQHDSTGKLLGEVVVIAQRKESRLLITPYSVETISKKDIDDYSPRTTPEALTGVNGVFIQKTNHGGGSPFLRGLTGNQTLILIDGIRLNNSTFRYGPNQYLNTIDVFTINKIEVAKGTGSVQYGSDAIGGVMQVFTKDPSLSTGKADWSGRVVSKYMMGKMENTLRGEANYSSKKIATIIGGTYKNFGDLVGGDTTGRQSPSGYKEFAFDAKTRLLLKSNIELTLAHQFLQQQHVPVYHKIVLENFAVNEFDPQQRILNYAKFNIKNKHKIISNIEMIGSWQQNIEGRNSRKNGSNTLRKERDEINTLGFTTDISSHLADVWSANSGIELYRDKVNSTREDVNIQSAVKTTLRGLYPDNSQYGNYALYSLHHFALNKWSVESGLRYNFFSISIKDTTLGNVKITPSSFVYNAALLYKLSNQQSLYLSFNTGYRAPNVDDMGTLGIVDFRYEVPTANLSPERSRNVELGYKVQAQKFAATLSGYYMHLNNLITRIKVDGQRVNGYQVYKKENVDEGYIKGFETEAEYQPLTGWLIKGNIAYAYGESLTKNEPLRRIPPFNGRLITTYNYKKWFCSAELLFASKQKRLAQGDKDDNRIMVGGTREWSVWNLVGSYQWKFVKLNFGLQNLFNKDYRTHGSGINGTGRSAWLSATIEI